MTNDGESKPPEADNGDSELPDDRKSDYWKTIVENFRRNDPLVTEVGLFCIKMVLILNGGAVIALMGIYPDLRTIEGIDSGFSEAGKLFLNGLKTAGAAALLSYIYQSYATMFRSVLMRLTDNQLKGKLTSYKKKTLRIHITRFRMAIIRMPIHFILELFDFIIIMLVCALCFISFTLFIGGGSSVLNVFKQFAATGT